MAAEIMSEYVDLPVEKVKTLFCNETGYQTPKLDTRSVIFKDDKILNSEDWEFINSVKK